MESDDQHVPTLEFLYRDSDVNTPELSEIPGILDDLIQDTYSGHEDSKIRWLYEQIATLQSQNRELEAYTSTVAHDLKDPLYAMILTSNIITNTPGLTKAELKKSLRQITATAIQMNTIITNLLLFAKVGNTDALVERVDMGQVVKNVRCRLSYSIIEHEAQLDLPPSWPDALGYAPWLEEVWANYISNALKHGGQHPHVELGATAQTDGMVRFWTRDNGPGVPPDDLARLFMPFSQISSIDTSGQGLGLSIVLRIVEKLGGQVGVESESGKGSQFFFTLPADLSRT